MLLPTLAPTVPSIHSPHFDALTTAGVFLGSPQLSIQQPESHRAACDLQGPAGPDPSASPASPPTTAPASSPHTCLPTCFRPWKHAEPSVPWTPHLLTHTAPSGFSLKSTSSGKPATSSEEDQVPCSRLSQHWCFSCGCLPPCCCCCWRWNLGGSDFWYLLNSCAGDPASLGPSSLLLL